MYILITNLRFQKVMGVLSVGGSYIPENTVLHTSALFIIVSKTLNVVVRREVDAPGG